MARRLACIFGGSGFVGRHVVRRLAAAGYGVRVAVRYPEDAAFLKPMGDVGQIVPVAADLRREGSVRAAAAAANLVVNLVGILHARRAREFERIHVEGAGHVAAAARAEGAEALVHVSALGAEAGSDSVYARSKAAGETAARAQFPAATVLRPSVIFGPEDDFFNRFAALSGWSPFLPVVVPRTGGLTQGGPRFQPVYVGDVADAIVVALTRPGHAGKTYSLGGPRVYSMREIMEMVVEGTERRRYLLPMPIWLARVQAAFLQFLPSPPLTPDQVKLLLVDNVVPPGAPGLAELGVAPTAAEAIVPAYLARFHNPFSPRQPRMSR